MHIDTKGRMYHMSQSKPNITSHIQSYCNGGFAFSRVTFSYSFSIPPNKHTACFRGFVKTQQAQGRPEKQTPTVTLPAGATVNVSLEKQAISILFHVMFCNICIVLFLYYTFFSHPIFWGVSLASSEETPLYVLQYIQGRFLRGGICTYIYICIYVYIYIFNEFTLTSNLIANSKHVLRCCTGWGLRARKIARTQRIPPIPNMGWK